MPRSAPGPATGAPSSSTRPVVGVSSPATMRSSVDLPQPDGPRIVMKSLSATASDTGCSATVGAPPRTPGNVRPTPSMTSLLIGPAQASDPGKQLLVAPLEREVGDEPDHADHDDAEDDLAGVEQRLAVGDHVADARRRADQLGDDHVGPRPAEHEAQRLGDRRCATTAAARGARRRARRRRACTRPRPGRVASRRRSPRPSARSGRTSR